VIYFKGVSHYIGHIKSRAETFAFVFSSASLLLIGGPSINLLFEYRTLTNVDLIVKVIGSQWYWNFEIRNLIEDAIQIYILPLDELKVGQDRFLNVDNAIVLPVGLLVQFNVTSRDVIHRFAIPSLGLKVDATSGLLRVIPLITQKVGVHYGQCSEICGINHAFMPFCLEITSANRFIYWLIC
jgi:cytochrome c oxidase subunit 2